MPSVRGVILDVDGTLVDSNDAHAHAWVEALAEHGREVPFAEVRRRIGEGGDRLLLEVSGLKDDSPEGRQISDRREQIFNEKYLPNLRPTPGAHDLLVHLHDAGLKLVVASSAKKDELSALLRVCGAEHLIPRKTSSDQVNRSKPAPDVVRAALNEIGLPAADVVMLGDTPYDVQAGRRAGVRVIGVRCGGWADEDLAGAVAVYNDPADLLAHYDASPLAPASSQA